MAKNNAVQVIDDDYADVAAASKRKSKAEKPAGGDHAKKKLFRALIVFLILAVITFVSLVAVLDLWGLRTWAVGLINPEAVSNVETNTTSPQEMVLIDWEKRLKAKEFELDQKQTSLEDTDKKLAEREKNVTDKENEINTLQADVTTLKANLSSQFAELTDLITTITNMKASQAAKMMESMEDDLKVASILKGMDEETAGAILNGMTPEFAARIIKVLYPE